jgi:regulator of replication initiation timing
MTITYNKRDWQSKVEKIDIWDDIKEQVINLFKFNNNKFYFLQITNPNLLTAFQMIKSYKNIYIAFDIEFQTAIVANNYKVEYNNKNEPNASFPLEIGMMIFIKDRENNIFYVGSIFRNFRSITEKGISSNNLKYMGAKYSTVSDKTIDKMELNDEIFTLEREIEALRKGNSKLLIKNEIFNLERDKIKKIVLELIGKFSATKEKEEKENYFRRIENILRKVQFNVFRKYLKDKKNRMYFDNQFELYFKDKLVKNRMMTVKEENKFLKKMIEISSNSCFIIKGTRDLDALMNMSIITNQKGEFNFDHLYDIEIFNGLSRLKYGSAQLEITYNGVINTDLYKKNSKELELIKKHISGIAHNPLVDSYFTLVVAIIISVGLDRYFPNNNQVGGSVYKYKLEYEKVKRKYYELK